METRVQERTTLAALAIAKGVADIVGKYIVFSTAAESIEMAHYVNRAMQEYCTDVLNNDDKITEMTVNDHLNAYAHAFQNHFECIDVPTKEKNEMIMILLNNIRDQFIMLMREEG